MRGWRTGLSQLGLGMEAPDALILDWAVLAATGPTSSCWPASATLFAADEEFRRECLVAAWVLRSQMSDEAEVTSEQVACGVRYLLAELPLLVDAAGIGSLRRGLHSALLDLPVGWRVDAGWVADESLRLLRIGEVARRSEASVKALRFYEEVGVVAPSARSPAGYRLYDRSVVDRVACVRAAQAAGLSLSEIAELFAALDDPSRPDALDRIAGCRECLEVTLEALRRWTVSWCGSQASSCTRAHQRVW